MRGAHARHTSQRQQGFELRRQPDDSTAPTQPPFDRNDVRRPGDRAASIYHWTPQIRDFADRRQELDWQLADLDVSVLEQLIAASIASTTGRSG